MDSIRTVKAEAFISEARLNHYDAALVNLHKGELHTITEWEAILKAIQEK